MLTESQKANRLKGVGASEAAIVLGLNENTSPYQLWLIKTGRVVQEDISNVPPVYWGSIHEESIAQEYAKRNRCNVRRINNAVFHKRLPFMLCHLDRKIEGQPKVLECKFAMFNRDNWGDPGSDVVPLPYIAQVQHQLACTGYQEADLAVLISGFDFRIYHFKRDEAIIKKIEREITTFWGYVEADIPPPLRDRTDAALAYPCSKGNLKDADDQIIQSVIKFKELKSRMKEIEEEKEKLESNLTLFIQEADGIKQGESVLATWKATKKGNRILRVLGE